LHQLKILRQPGYLFFVS